MNVEIPWLVNCGETWTKSYTCSKDIGILTAAKREFTAVRVVAFVSRLILPLKTMVKALFALRSSLA